MRTISETLEGSCGWNQVAVPDLWQQQAVAALRDHRDVVVHAPTGAGKTLIFELWSKYGKNRGKAIYTVPTRALANDKLAEWRARGWDVGIATGDLAENLDAPIVVATLETQKHRLIRGDGPACLVVDEYQMLGDADRGLNYELALAMAPPHTQLLLLSGSVANPQDIVKWLTRLGRNPVLVRHDTRPVPLEEVWPAQLSIHLPSEIRGYWPRFVAKALAEDLGPILIFAPRRQAAEALAAELARQLPLPAPLALSAQQKQLVGEDIARLLKCRVACHHSGLSYGARAGVIEPLAKAGQLRVVVATMGLAAGINFSLRSVALAGESYRRDELEHPLRPDEILQMYGRAGRRGIDDTGYVLVSANEIRLRDGHPAQLTRSGLVDWATLLGVMQTAADQGRSPFADAVRVQQRLFTSRPVVLGVEEALRHPQAPCGLATDAERARHVRRRVREMLNSAGQWQPGGPVLDRPLREVWVVEPINDHPNVPTPPSMSDNATSAPTPVRVVPALSHPPALERFGHGALAPIPGDTVAPPVYGRAVILADAAPGGAWLLKKWVRRWLRWTGRPVSPDAWASAAKPTLEARFAAQRTPVVRWIMEPGRLLAFLSLGELTTRVAVDTHGRGLWRPHERDVAPADCGACALQPVCRELPKASGAAALWRKLQLIDAAGVPTRRGRVVSFFSQGDGLALAAALEDEAYPLEELAFDVANLAAGFRFAGETGRWSGRLAQACQRQYGLLTIPGYLENGLPPKYGGEAEQIVAAVHKDPASRHQWVSDLAGPGDIDRLIIEWRSTLRQIAHAPPLDWPRWNALRALAATMLRATSSPTLTELPPLDYQQTRRVDHRLLLRRH